MGSYLTRSSITKNQFSIASKLVSYSMEITSSSSLKIEVRLVCSHFSTSVIVGVFPSVNTGIVKWLFNYH